MDFIGSALVAISAVGLLFGLVVAFHPLPALGLANRRDGVFIIVAAVAISALAHQISPKLQEEALARDASSKVDAAQRAKEKENIRISSFNAYKINDNKMSASFIIYNGNQRPIKDITVACTNGGSSGTVSNRLYKTVYERIPGNGSHSVVNLIMGEIDSAVSATRCRISNFEWA